MILEKEVAAPVQGAADFKAERKRKPEQYNINDADRLAEMALSVAPGGELHEFLPERPDWYRRIGAELHAQLAARAASSNAYPSAPGYQLHPRDRDRLNFLHQLALARKRGAAIGPAYPARSEHGSLTDARQALHTAFKEILADTVAYNAAISRMAA